MPRIASERTDELSGFAPQRSYLVIHAVGVEQICLLGIDPKVEIPNRPGAQRILFDDELLDEGAVLAEDLNSVVGAIANIDEAVLGDLHAMNRIAELRRRRRCRAVRR